MATYDAFAASWRALTACSPTRPGHLQPDHRRSLPARTNIPAAQLNLTAYRMHPAQDLTSRLLSTENSPLSAPLTGRSGTVYSVGFSPGGRMLASGSWRTTWSGCGMWPIPRTHGRSASR